jgi:hypothetical protein
MSIIADSVLVESKTARDLQLSAMPDESAIAALNKAKALCFFAWKKQGIATTEQIAEFYEVTENVVHQVARRHRAELESDGLRTIKGDELRALRKWGQEASDMLSNASCPDDLKTLQEEDSKAIARLVIANNVTNLSIWTPRASLRLGMLLQDSLVAEQVRTSLLDKAEEPIAPTAPPPEPEQPKPLEPIAIPGLISGDPRLAFLREAIALGEYLGGFDQDQREILKAKLLSELIEGVTKPVQQQLPPSGGVPLPAVRMPAYHTPRLTISNRASAMGYRPNNRELIVIGQRAAKLYKERYGIPPLKERVMIGGTECMVNVYHQSEIVLLDNAIQSVMESLN